MEQLNTIIDKTLPIEPNKEVVISLLDIEKYINKEKVYEQLIELADYINSLTNNVFCFGARSFFKISSYLNNENLDRIIYPSIENIDSFICTYLNCSDKTIENGNDAYRKRIEDLKKIKNMDELRDKFPFVYNDYFIMKHNLITIKQESLLGSSYKEFILARDRYGQKKSELKYYESNKDMNLFGYINDFCTGLNILCDSIDIINSYFLQNQLDIELEYKSEKDKDKVELIVANAYMDRLKKAKDVNQKQIYLYYLSNFFDRYVSKINHLKAYLQGKDEIIKLKDLYDDYIKELKENPNLRIIDFKKEDFSDMSIEETKEFMDEYLKDLHATWKFFDGSSLNIDDDFIKEIKEKIISIPDFDKKNKALENLKLFIEKKEYYDSSDPFYRIQGINSFDGYIGYIYPNGIVVLDKFFENTKTNRLAKNQAIYVMNIMDLYSISINSKNTIITNSLCERFIHKGDWKSKLDEERKKNTRIYTAKELEGMIAKGIVKR